MARKQKPNPHTVSEPISAKLSDVTTISGILWFHPSKRGSFEVEHNGVRHSDGRSDYTNEAHIRSIARIILRDLAERG